MSTHEVILRVPVRVTVPDDSDAVSRYVGLSPEKGAETYTEPGLTESQVLYKLAFLSLLGRSDASYCDGWADLDRGLVTMNISYQEVEESDY